MNTAKKLLLAPVVAAIAFASLQSFATASDQVKCVGSTGYCRITTSGGTVIESRGNAEVTPVEPAPAPAPTVPAQDANLVASDL